MKVDWLGLKNEAARMLLDRDALHIYAGLLIQFAVAKLSRRSLGHIMPWLAVLGLELANEVLDVWWGGEPRLMPWQIVSAIHDVVNTMLLPTVLLLLCRRAPRMFDWHHADPKARRGGLLAETATFARAIDGGETVTESRADAAHERHSTERLPNGGEWTADRSPAFASSSP